MKAIRILTVSALMLLTFMVASRSAMANELKIGVVDVRSVLSQAPQVKLIKQKLQRQFKPREQKIRAAQSRLKKNLAKLERDGTVMGAKARQSLEQKIVAERRAFQRMSQDFQQDLSLAQNQAMQKFFKKLKAIVNKVAAKQHYDIILQKEATPYASRKIDITRQVVKALG